MITFSNEPADPRIHAFWRLRTSDSSEEFKLAMVNELSAWLSNPDPEFRISASSLLLTSFLFEDLEHLKNAIIESLCENGSISVLTGLLLLEALQSFLDRELATENVKAFILLCEASNSFNGSSLTLELKQRIESL